MLRSKSSPVRLSDAKPWRAGLLFLALPVLPFAGCTHQTLRPSTQPNAPVLSGDSAHPPSTRGWLDTRLYFGLGPADHPEQGINESAWRQFLDREVTPRFPDGLTVLDGYGQWEGKNETVPERLRSKILLIDYPDNAENRRKIDAIRSAWKKLTGDQSVLRVTQPADVSF